MVMAASSLASSTFSTLAMLKKLYQITRQLAWLRSGNLIPGKCRALEEQMTEWALSPHHARLSRINPAMPSRGFRRLVVEFSRVQTSVLVQLRTGHMLLSKHLF